MTFNEALWDLVNHLGWWFWMPFVGYGVYSINLMYRLAPATSMLGRSARVIWTAAFLCMIFTPMFNGLGPYAFHLVSIGTCILMKQTYDACKAAGRIKPPESVTVAGRLAERVTDKMVKT